MNYFYIQLQTSYILYVQKVIKQGIHIKTKFTKYNPYLKK
jgi:hypothetical protein